MAKMAVKNEEDAEEPEPVKIEDWNQPSRLKLVAHKMLNLVPHLESSMRVCPLFPTNSGKSAYYRVNVFVVQQGPIPSPSIVASYFVRYCSVGDEIAIIK